MTTYRHTSWMAFGERPPQCWGDGQSLAKMCGCTTPTPDPASPCGFEGCWMTGLSCHCDDPSEGCPGGHPITADGGHPFVATRCVTCGHAIEVAP